MIQYSHSLMKTPLLSNAAGLIFLLGALAVNQAWSQTYQCEDLSGTTVITDSPAQLEKCVLLFDESSNTTVPIPPAPTKPYQSSDPLTNQEYENEDLDVEHENGEFGIDGEEESDIDETETVSVPVTTKGGSLVVPVRLNDTRNAQLILDTGATMTVLSTDVAIELGLMSNTDTQVTTVNTAGGPVQVNMTRVGSIQIDAAKVKNVMVVIHDLPEVQPGVDGLLGMSFLNSFLVTLDTKQGQLHLRSRR